MESRSPTLQVDTLPAEPQGKPKNTGVGSLSPLQGIFLTQELNRGLLHCRRILYQLSYEGSEPQVRHLPANAGDTRDAGSIPELGRFPGGGNDNPLQYSCLGNSMGRGAWRAIVHGVAENWT